MALLNATAEWHCVRHHPRPPRLSINIMLRCIIRFALSVLSVHLGSCVAPAQDRVLTENTNSAASAENTERPNIVWIIADDLGPELGCYGYSDVDTPNLDRLAAAGIRYTHAFSTAPVCSSSRTAFQTGRYQTRIGGHHHNTRDKPVLPPDVPTVTGLMRAAGYFCCNGRGYPDKKTAKSHFNFVYESKTFFDGIDWSQRRPGQPFFAQVQIKEPHRQFVKHARLRKDAKIPPYYPEHPITRADWSNYLASIEVLDQKVGAVLDRLDREGLASKTVVVFFGDHGRPHVRGKQFLYDGGLHVPLLIRWPATIQPGQVRGDLVSLLDLMPTTLAAAGIDIPNTQKLDLPGHDLLATTPTRHSLLFAARDRCGDAPDRIRSVRTRQYKYIRNFHPEIPYLQLSSYKKLQYPVQTLMKELHRKGEWNSPFMAETRPEEELYFLPDDPNEMSNLANDPDHAETLVMLRKSLDEWIKQTGDQGAVDESQSVDMDALMKSKRNGYEKAMSARRLAPDLSDEEYLEWWSRELTAVKNTAVKNTAVKNTAAENTAAENTTR